MSLETGTYPRGLASLLNLKEGGRTPGLLSEEISGVLDLTTAYLLTLLEYEASNLSQAAPVVGLNDWSPQFTVPTGQLWYVWGYTVAAAPGAGAAIDLAACAKFGGNNLTVALTEYANAAAAQEVRRSARDFWLPPGSVLGFLVRSVTAAPTVTGGLVITRLRV